MLAGPVRLNRYLAGVGLGSRRACEKLIEDRRVSINGRTVDDLATRVEPDDRVRLDGRDIGLRPPAYLALHKPRGILTTCADPSGRDTVLDLLPKHLGRLFPVGRLDKDSEGLLLLTNDGALAQVITHPSHSVEKEYEVHLDRPFDPAIIHDLLEGFYIEGGKARMQSVYRLANRKIKVILKQGIKRQIRLMLQRKGYEVLRLKRIRVGAIRLGNLRIGEWRHLDKSELRAMSGAPRTSSFLMRLPSK